MPVFDVWVDSELLMGSRQGELGVRSWVGEEEYGEKKDFGSKATGVSSSESAGVCGSDSGACCCVG
jgi:hypothetical protein